MCQAFDVDYFFFFLLENFGDLDVISRSQGCKKKKASLSDQVQTLFGLYRSGQGHVQTTFHILIGDICV